MHADITGETFSIGKTIYVFEAGECEFLAFAGYNEDDGHLLKVKIGDEIGEVASACCFHIRDDGTYSRLWQWNDAVIEVTYEPIKLFNRGPATLVRYGAQDSDEELLSENGALHKDWEGYGIDFPLIIDKWLRRLNGEVIPLSDYYQNPINRWADSL